MYVLYIANKNYSSWSLRPWVLMRELAIPFSERLVRFDDPSAWSRFRAISPAARCPASWTAIPRCGSRLRSQNTWRAPSRGLARRPCRARLRAQRRRGNACRIFRASQSLLHELRRAHPPARDSGRAHSRHRAARGSLGDGLSRFGGPFLAGAGFTAVDAFFAPVAFRAQTYGLHLGADAAAYVGRLLELDSMRRWYADGVAETFRDEPHEKEMAGIGRIIEDLRAR